MIKLKIDGEMVEYKDWCHAHDDVKTSVLCEGIHHCNPHCGIGHEYCECIEKCVRDDLNAKHTWEVVEES